MSKRLRIWLPTIFWASLIFYVSSIPNLKVTEESFLQNLINISAHFTEYLVLTILILRSQRQDPDLTLNPIQASVIAFFYSVTDEFHQFFIPGRQADPYDVLVDTLGAIFAIQIWKRINSHRQKS